MSDNNVGILAMEVYFPSLYVKQDELEKAYGVPAGKHTIGLGQDAMAFTGDREDINSIALTVVHSLLEKYSISPKDIGRLEIGTESLIDKSKSTKTVLMSLFEDAGNHDIEGVTVVNACYGGTAALLNALNWCDSSSWDGRYAIVVAADIAVYADGPARPTGGCGSVAMLIGRDAPLKIELKTRVCYATHTWDFFKPKMSSEYPEVNGALSQTCYFTALDDCYTRYIEKKRKHTSDKIGINDTDYFLFHSPYNKLVQKSFGRLIYNDIRSGLLSDDSFDEWKCVQLSDTYEDKRLESKLKEKSLSWYNEKVSIGCEVSRQVGNTYTASVYMNLANLISTVGDDVYNKSITIFSYGSGAVASMFEVIPRVTSSSSNSSSSKFSIKEMQVQLSVGNRLKSREKLSPQDLTIALEVREKSHTYVPYIPLFGTENMFPGTYYLTEISDKYERTYKRKAMNAPVIRGGPLVERSSSRSNSNDVLTDGINTKLSLNELDNAATPLKSNSMKRSMNSFIPPTDDQGVASSPLGGLGLKRNQTFVWASGRPNVKVVVTGAAAALPGRDGISIEPGLNNIQRIIAGINCITPIPDHVKNAMLDKNVVELVRLKDGTQVKRAISKHEENINVCASIGSFNLKPYGVSDSIASTMDQAVQVAVAAGLEALRDARIVTGEGENGWVLPKSMQNSTGIVYATSFPALDAAIGEVSKYFETKTVTHEHIPVIIEKLRHRLQTECVQHTTTTTTSDDGSSSVGTLSIDTENALAAIERFALDNVGTSVKKEYEFDRKFLFRVLVLGNAQLAQIIKARGPNMQTNAACAGATQAIALAYDMIQVGRAERMIVVAGDNASSDTLMPWLGNGFRALGAATICPDVSMASIPFDRRRSGMILGSGGIGMVLESEEGALRRHSVAISSGLYPTGSIPSRAFRCRLLGTLISNSAYHGASLDRQHIAEEMERFIASVEKENGITRAEIAKNGVYFSHETSTHASPTSSCASNEIHGLRQVFGDNFKHLLILNTKGFTGHPMGVSFEDVVASEVLLNGFVPPIANFTEGHADPNLGDDVKLSRGGAYPCKYAMRFAAGFGSQIALALYGSCHV